MYTQFKIACTGMQWVNTHTNYMYHIIIVEFILCTFKMNSKLQNLVPANISGYTVWHPTTGTLIQLTC